MSLIIEKVDNAKTPEIQEGIGSGSQRAWWRASLEEIAFHCREIKRTYTDSIPLSHFIDNMRDPRLIINEALFLGAVGSGIFGVGSNVISRNLNGPDFLPYSLILGAALLGAHLKHGLTVLEDRED